MSKKSVKCPYCHGPALYDLRNPYRPFCSERCRTQDLGKWANEDYRIPSESQEVTDGTKPIEDPSNELLH